MPPMTFFVPVKSRNGEIIIARTQDPTRECAVPGCNKQLLDQEFPVIYQDPRGGGFCLRRNCRKCNNIYTKISRMRNNLLLYRERMRLPCFWCGKKVAEGTGEFAHRHGTIKKFSVGSSSLRRKTYGRFRTEIDKCNYMHPKCHEEYDQELNNYDVNIGISTIMILSDDELRSMSLSEGTALYRGFLSRKDLWVRNKSLVMTGRNAG